MSFKYVETIYNEERAPKSSYPTKLVNYLSEHFGLKKGMNLLEIGCGRGDFLKAFDEYGFVCSGIDIDPSAKKFTPNVEIQIADISVDTFPYKDNSFDIVYHKSVIEHVYSPLHLMNESTRVLKPGGKLIILTPDWVSQMKVFYEDITHCRPYDISALRDTFQMFNIHQIHVEKFRQLPCTWNNRFFNIIAKILSQLISVVTGRQLTKITGLKFFRWSVELMILGSGVK